MIDRATIVALTGLVGLLVWVTLAGAGTAAWVFWRTPSLALVVGGAVLTTVLAFPIARIGSLPSVLKNAFFVRTRAPKECIATIVSLAEVARRRGLLALEKPVEYIQEDFLKRAMRMAVDGADPRTVETVMQAELEGIDLRHASGAGLFRSMGTAAPAFGMIGTLIGLVLMLGQMNDPTRIGPGMAVALLTTLYGLLVANVFCFPIARRLENRSSEELLSKTIMLKGVLAIQAGDNPRVVEQKLRAYLPSEARKPRWARSPLGEPASVDHSMISSQGNAAAKKRSGVQPPGTEHRPAEPWSLEQRAIPPVAKAKGKTMQKTALTAPTS